MVAIAGGELAVDGMRELPLAARDDGAPRFARVAHRKHVSGIIRCGYGIFVAAHASSNQMSKRNFRHRVPGHEIAAEQSGNRLAVFFRDGRIEFERVVAWGVPLPTEGN